MGALKTIARVLACVLIFGQARAHALTLTLAWDPSTDPTVVGYILSYGTASGSYTQQLDAGNASTLVVANLDDHTTYYFSVQSYDLGQLHLSPRSAEVVYSPLQVTCINGSGTSPDGNPVVVSFPAPVIAGAAPPVTVSCSPASGSAFSVGSTSFSCTVTDVVMSAACTGSVTVNAAAPGTGGGGSTGGGGGGGGTSGGGTSGGGTSSSGGSSSGSGSSSTPSSPTGSPAGSAPSAGNSTPTYEVPPPPGSFGFSDHGYFRPDGGWQETRRIGGGSTGGAIAAPIVGGGCVSPSAGVPLYEVPAPPGASGFSDHGYYRPDGGWQETRLIGGAGGSSCVPVYTNSYSGPAPVASSGSTGFDYDTPPPAGSYGFTDTGYFRPDGGWQRASSRRVNSGASYAASTAPAAASSMAVYSGTPTSAFAGSATSAPYQAPVSSGAVFVAAAPSRAGVVASAPAATPAGSGVQVFADASPAQLARVDASSGTAIRQPDQRVVMLGGAIVRPPAAPANATPIDTAFTPVSFDASWSSDPNADSYDVYLGVSSEPALFKRGVIGSVLHVDGLAPNTTYYWRVVARNAGGETASGTWTFTTRNR